MCFLLEDWIPWEQRLYSFLPYSECLLLSVAGQMVNKTWSKGWVRNWPADLMKEVKNVWRIQIIYNIFSLSLPFPMFPCLCVFQSQFMPCWELMIKGVVIRKGRLLSPDTPFLIASACVYVSEEKKKACIIFLWALRFILFCCQTFGNAFYKLYWDKISRDVCICLSSAKYYFLMHFWLCRQRIQ